jgi:glutathione S-transferase
MMVLRYFAIVGRAQPLRHALADSGVAYEDVRVTTAEWMAHRDDLAFGGPYRALPTLTCDGETISETLAIASFLARRLGHHEGMDDLATARLDAVCSTAYTEVMVRVAEIVWADRLYPGVNVQALVPRLLECIVAKLGRLDAQVPKRFFGGPRAVMADFFAAEAYEALSYLMGARHAAAIENRLPRLAALTRRVRTLPRVAKVDRPDRFTARPDEPAILERVRLAPGYPI